jgi:hypothetical protein
MCIRDVPIDCTGYRGSAQFVSLRIDSAYNMLFFFSKPTRIFRPEGSTCRTGSVGRCGSQASFEGIFGVGSSLVRFSELVSREILFGGGRAWFAFLDRAPSARTKTIVVRPVNCCHVPEKKKERPNRTERTTAM